MEDSTIIIVLAIVFLVFLAVVLIVETVRLKFGFKEQQQAEEDAKAEKPQLISIKQKAGEVRIAYLATPDENYVPEEAAAAAESESERAVKEQPAKGQPAEEQAAEGVFVPIAEKLTFAEKYGRLTDEYKRYIDEFAAYITEKPDCVKLLQTNALTFKYKRGLIVKAIIRRETVVLNFALANPNLGRMVQDEKIKAVKLQPVEVRLLSEEDVEFAKQTADMTLSYLQQEEDYRIEKRREARREAARQRREAEMREEGSAELESEEGGNE